MKRVQRSVGHLFRRMGHLPHALARLVRRGREVPAPSGPALPEPSRWQAPVGADDEARNAALRRELETRARALGIKRARQMSTAELAREIAKRF